jgi:hypothetical protein
MTTSGKINNSELAYVESLSPGDGYAPARASGAIGSIRLSLDGTWRFRYGHGLEDLTPGFEATDFDDAHFDDITVPSHWQLAGVPGPPRYGSPAYTNVTYPSVRRGPVQSGRGHQLPGRVPPHRGPGRADPAQRPDGAVPRGEPARVASRDGPQPR